MSDNNSDVNITLIGHDQASQPIDSATKKINDSWKKMNNEQRAVRREFELNNRTLHATSKVIGSIGFAINRVQGIYNTWNLLQIRSQDAARNLRDAIKEQEDALSQYGPASREFFNASENVQDVMKENERVARDTALGYGIMIASLVTGASSIVTQVIPKIKILNSVLKGGTSAAATAAAKTSTTIGSAGGAAGKTGSSLLKKLAGGGAAATGVGLALGVVSDFQPAYGGDNDQELPGGVDAIAPFLNKAGETIINIVNNIFSPTPDAIVSNMDDATKRSLSYGAK